MDIDTKEIVSISELLRNYKQCVDKVKKLGKVVVFKNNVPDLVVMDIDEYEKLFEQKKDGFDPS